MRVAELTNLVHLEGENEGSQGRAYSCGVSNAGVVSYEGKHGPYSVDSMHFAVSHARTGSAYQLSCVTVDGNLHSTFHPPGPLVSEQESTAFADGMMDLLKVAAGAEISAEASADQVAVAEERQSIAREKRDSESRAEAVATAAAVLGIGAAILAHLPAWQAFLSEVQIMKDLEVEDFSAVLQFWTFFAAMHPILKPVLWISEVLHASPGPRAAELVPWTFVGLNVVALGLINRVAVVRTLVNGALAALFLADIGSGLSGTGSLSGYNLALNDGVRGCPTYEQVRQPSMDKFDVSKYQGRGYEIGFHDYTQFTEVYDTSLDIELNADGSRWLDDFGLKGPSPASSPRSV